MKKVSVAKVLLFAVFCALLVSCGGGGSGTTTVVPPPLPPPTPAPPGANPVSTVAVVLLENTSYENIIGTNSMPFLNSLLPQGALATQYFADTHPSIGNYFMLTAGQIETNDDAFTGSVSDDNIVRRLVAAGKTWKGYFQSIPSAGYTGNDVYPYIKHHNPFSYFTDVTQNSAQAANIISLSQLTADTSAGTFPNFMFIVPDNEHNAHDCITGGSACTLADKLAAADGFLSANIQPLLNNATFKQNGLLFIVFDEGNATDGNHVGGHVVMFAAGASHAKAGFQSANTYQHQNALRTFSDLLGVSAPGLGGVATPMSDLLQ